MTRTPVTLETAQQAAIDAALTTTRAVRRRLDLYRAVDLTLVRQALSVAHQGPSGGAEEPVRWIVVTDPGTRRRVGQAYREAYEELDRERAVPAGDGAERIRRVRASSAHLAAVLDRVPVHVLVCSAGPAPAGPHGADAAKFYASVFPAVWSFQVALRARGLGSCLTTVGLRRAAHLAAAVDLPADWTCCALLPVAHITGEGLSEARRAPLEEVTRWI